MNFGVFVAAIAGISFGYWFFMQNKQSIMSFVYNFRLIADPAYREACLDVLVSQNFYATAKPQYNVLPRSDHFDALLRTRDRIDNSLYLYYRVILKHLAAQAIIYTSVPIFIFALFSTAQYFLAAVLISIVFISAFEMLFMNQTGYIFHMRLSALLMHAYADAGYRARVHRPQKSKEHDSVRTNEPTKSFPEMIIPAKPVSALSTTAASVSVMDEDDSDDDIIIPSSKPTKLRSISLSTAWWGTDALVSFGIVVGYWITESGSLLDTLLTPLVLIVFLQVFFVPMWFVIQIARKLLAPQPRA